MSSHRRRLWRVAVVAVIMLSALSFTPLVLNPNGTEPTLLGMPHTLWAGMAVAFLLVALTVVGAYVHPDSETDGEPE